MSFLLRFSPEAQSWFSRDGDLRFCDLLNEEFGLNRYNFYWLTISKKPKRGYRKLYLFNTHWNWTWGLKSGERDYTFCKEVDEFLDNFFPKAREPKIYFRFQKQS